MPIPLKVLIVEDHPADADLIMIELRRAGYQLDWQRVDTEAEYLAKLDPALDLVIADYNLPRFDGLRALDLLNARQLDIPFILVSGSIGEELAVAAMKHGASDYLLKDRPARLGAAVSNALEQRRLRHEQQRSAQELRESEARLASIVGSAMDAIITLDAEERIILFNAAAEKLFHCPATDTLHQPLTRFIPAWNPTQFARGENGFLAGQLEDAVGLRADGERFPFEASFSQFEVSGQRLSTVILRDITERKRAEAAVQQAHGELEQAYEATLEGWSMALNLRDNDTELHTMRVTKMTVKLAREMGITGEQLTYAKWGALLHDIGKMGIPDSILLKPGPLTDYEWSIMRLHPGYAYQMLAPIAYLRPALDIPYCHHEKWDGTGYPRGLHAEQIPLAARIFAIIDVWDALSFNRPYRSAWPLEKVMNHVQALAGTHFDPQVVEVFMRVATESPATG